MNEEPLILADRARRVQYLTLNRPRQLNPLSRAMREALVAALDEAESDPDVRVIVIRGAGRAFSAGHDVSRSGWEATHVHERVDPVAVSARSEKHHRMMLRIWDCSKPVIAQVHGYCLAGATIIPALADLTIVATDAVIGFVRLPFGAGQVSPSWVHLVGLKRAKEMAFIAGSSIDGLTAVEWGFANHAYPANELDAEVRKLAIRIAATPSDGLRLKKRALNRMVELGGFREGFLNGPQGSALYHFSPELDELSRRITEQGWIATAKQFHKDILREIEEGDPD